jgi:hypothetical protein
MKSEIDKNYLILIELLDSCQTLFHIIEFISFQEIHNFFQTPILISPLFRDFEKTIQRFSFLFDDFIINRFINF